MAVGQKRKKLAIKAMLDGQLRVWRILSSESSGLNYIVKCSRKVQFLSTCAAEGIKLPRMKGKFLDKIIVFKEDRYQ